MPLKQFKTSFLEDMPISLHAQLKLKIWRGHMSHNGEYHIIQKDALREYMEEDLSLP